jgi:S-(hydroxymethyl)glutathione dehydrogenase/alcohol dehydrogenase
VKAAVSYQVNAPLVIEEVRVDKPKAHEVLLRTLAVGVCHSDLHFINGAYPAPFPFIPGHEAASVVEQVGSEVRGVKPGDRVITCLNAFCGVCEYCISGHLSLCQSPATRRSSDEAPRLARADGPVSQMFSLSAFAEQMLVHEHACVPIRKDMPAAQAALIGCAVMTGYGAVVRTSGVRPGETVAVIGCGGIGLNAINAAALVGAARIIAIDKVGSKLNLAKHFGATDVIDASQGDPVEQVLEMTGGGVRHSFEAIGTKGTAEQAFRMLGRGGTANVIGLIPVGTKVEIHGADLLGERRIQGSMMGSNQFPVDMPRLVDFYMAGKLKLDDLISQRIRLDQVNEALAELEHGEIARSVIEFDA